MGPFYTLPAHCATVLLGLGDLWKPCVKPIYSQMYGTFVLPCALDNHSLFNVIFS